MAIQEGGLEEGAMVWCGVQADGSTLLACGVAKQVCRREPLFSGLGDCEWSFSVTGGWGCPRDVMSSRKPGHSCHGATFWYPGF